MYWRLFLCEIDEFVNVFHAEEKPIVSFIDEHRGFLFWSKNKKAKFVRNLVEHVK